MEDINKQIEKLDKADDMFKPFEIKNNFIPTKDQMSMSPKFNTKSIDRGGRPMVSNPDIQTAGEIDPLGDPIKVPEENIQTL
jgi:hypothetical protein